MDMLNRLKNRVLTVVAPDLPALPPGTSNPSVFSSSMHRQGGSGSKDQQEHGKMLPEKFHYARPCFLQLNTEDEVKASADHNVRPIIVPRDLMVLPWNIGYAECVNSGKSKWNEDQAAFHQHRLTHPLRKYPDLPYTYVGIYDGHAGYGAALAAANQFHHILHQRLVDVIDLLWPRGDGDDGATGSMPHPIGLFHRQVSRDELIIGALESAFADMDTVLAEDRNKFRNAGGCTALVSLFILGKLYVANAGDSRGILCKRLPRASINHTATQTPAKRSCWKGRGSIRGAETVATAASQHSMESDSDDEMMTVAEPCSFDHTPDTERQRLLMIGKHNSALLGEEYIAKEYAKKPTSRDLGTRILYRQGAMCGWSYKTLTVDDLKIPLVTGSGKRSRLLGTIGVTRGFGDHELKALGCNLPIKPFLSSHPDVTCFDLTQVQSDPSGTNCDGEYGILVMATDGLWDVSESQQVARNVFATLKRYPTEPHRYTMVAQELVARSRGRANESGHWRLAESRSAATVDDISVLVIPVYRYYSEYLAWAEMYDIRNQHKGSVADPLPLNRSGEAEHSIKEQHSTDKVAITSTKLQQQQQQQHSSSSGSLPHTPEDAQEAENNLNLGNQLPSTSQPPASLTKP
ncbi:phosphatase 2C eta [Anopheles darlingi]|uniref:Phosphatase 2C eta n=1 Tax=Anopheles darlingi TaxID=43151 RepID=W5J6P5_ANODA|nr:protein phosphatase 1H [Anopheles darlingi]ETN60132.1 phosphatase 2C eta [Anopheles darlingi]